MSAKAETRTTNGTYGYVIERVLLVRFDIQKLVCGRVCRGKRCVRTKSNYNAPPAAEDDSHSQILVLILCEDWLQLVVDFASCLR